MVVLEAIAHPDAEQEAEEEESGNCQLHPNVEVIALLQQWVNKGNPGDSLPHPRVGVEVPSILRAHDEKEELDKVEDELQDRQSG